MSIFVLGGINAAGLTQICIDKTPPSPPSNLEVTISGDDVTLTWGASTDIPECSGVDYYIISRDEVEIGTTSSLIFINKNVNPGNYSYTVYAIDKIGHNSGLAIKNDVIIEEVEGKKKVHGGGGGSSYVCYENWQCNPWSECIDEVMVRTCTDFNKCGTTKEKPQTSSTCSPDEEGEGILLGEPSEKGFFSRITGAVIGGVSNFAKSSTGAFVFIILILATGGFVLIRLYKLRKK